MSRYDFSDGPQDDAYFADRNEKQLRERLDAAVAERDSLREQRDALELALNKIADETERRQLPITTIINDLAIEALATVKK
jgi:hypothetical protein